MIIYLLKVVHLEDRFNLMDSTTFKVIKLTRILSLGY